jgi:hypothetical protein
MRRDLNAFERWMVSSNLKTIEETGVTHAEQAEILRANGYEHIAAAVEEQR